VKITDEREMIENYAELFTLRAAENPRAIAASFQGRSLSYHDLDELSDRLAEKLRSLGIGPECVVAVFLERSLEAIASFLGIWKAGGAYLPIDPRTPPERITRTVADAGVRLVVTDSILEAKITGAGVEAVRVDALESGDRKGIRNLNPARPEADRLAYLMYTSGSTGVPKGVEITHHSLLNHNYAVIDIFGLRPGDRVLQFASLSFDLSVEEIFPTLLAGATLVLRTEDCISSITRFLRFVEQQRVTILNLPTAFWHQLAFGLAAHPLPTCVRLVIVGGEKASNEAWRQWKLSVNPRVRFINTYGPTESTVTATCYEPDHCEDTLCIGSPIANTSAFVLDAHLTPVPDGEVGELFLGGAGLARGYHARPELTEERFMTAPPWLANPGARLYRTGDLVRCRPDGNLDFVGRNDEQFKIRGFRVEPSEITAALLGCANVTDAVVTLRTLSPGNKQLVAYVVVSRHQEKLEHTLRSELKLKLPHYMIPAAFVVVPGIPRNTSGKLDGSLLPEPVRTRDSLEAVYEQPQSEVERQLVAIWQEVLHVDAVGLQDNFFDLGGDSLLALQVAARVRELLNCELNLSTIFDGQTISAIADQVRQQRSGLSQNPREFPGSLGDEEIPASFVQEQLWFLHELSPRSDAYHLPFALRLKGRLNLSALGKALDKIVARHEALRTTFHEKNGRLVQQVTPELKLSPSLELSLREVANQTILQKFLKEEARRPFDLERGPLIRVSLLKTGSKDHVLLLVMHHAISDGWSLGLFTRELQQIYAGLVSGNPAEILPSLTAQYSDFARWQRRQMSGIALEKETAWWQERLKDAPAQVKFATKSETSPAGSGRSVECLPLELSAKKLRRLLAVARNLRTTPFVLLLTALATALQQHTGQNDLVIGTVVAGRTRRDFENLIGCFMNFLPLRMRLEPGEDCSTLLPKVRRTVLDAQSHQECPFEKVVAALNPDRAPHRNPLYNVGLLWQQFPVEQSPRRNGLQLVPLEIMARTNLLDLRLEAEQRGAKLNINFEYNPDVLTGAATVELMGLFSKALATFLRSKAANRKGSTRLPIWRRLLSGSQELAGL
jgi:amino acid adenylation domain-containing protein